MLFCSRTKRTWLHEPGWPGLPRSRHLRPTLCWINLKTELLQGNKTNVFCPHKETDKMFCVYTTTIRGTFEHAHIEALSSPWSRLPANFSSLPPYLKVVTLLFTRRRLLFFLIYLACQTVRRTLRKKKPKLNTFHGLMHDEVELLFNVTVDYKTAIKLDIMDTKKTIISSSAMLDLWSRKTRAMKSHDNHDVAERRRFRKVPFSKCSPSTIIRLARGVFKFFHCGDRFRWRIYPDSYGLVWAEGVHGQKA